MEEIKNSKIFNNKTQIMELSLRIVNNFLKKHIDEEINMSQFQSASWENVNIPQKQHQETREGDWICNKCNNLNFSFRKKCNRCKVQSRQDNYEEIRQAYQAYQDYYRQFDPQECREPQTLKSSQASACCHLDSHAFDPQYELEDAFEQQCWGLELPSVSPIIKRYKKEKTTPKTQLSQVWSSDDQGSEGSEYLQKYCWQNIMIDDEVDNEYSGRDSYDVWDTEIEKIVQSIVL